MKNYAFIDSQNLHIEIKKLGWEIDYRKFRVFLKDKYKISKAFTFIGYDQNNQKLYNSLEKKGYKLIFKPILKDKTGKIKGNCDAELVLHTMIEFDNFNKAIIISGDGDFYCLIKYLAKNNKLLKIGIPNKKSGCRIELITVQQLTCQLFTAFVYHFLIEGRIALIVRILQSET